MAYQVTARKWRPRQFDEVVGQEHITATLKNAVHSGRIAQCYLFCGPRGVGKTTTARILAKVLNCADLRDGNSCEACNSCQSIAASTSMNVLEIDGASNNSVDDVRELREVVRYAATEGVYKIYIIDEVHMLSTAAFNALLKTLEEPPEHVVFIFATTEVQSVPDTILSRCQRFNFRRISAGQIAAHLGTIAQAEGIAVEEGALHLLASRADGALRDAESLLDQVVSLGAEVSQQAVVQVLGLVDRDLYFELLDAIREATPAQVLDVVAQAVDEGADIEEFVYGLVELLRHLLFAKIQGRTDELDMAEDARRRCGELAAAMAVEDLLRMMQSLLDLEADLKRSLQPRFRLEIALVHLALMGRSVDVGELLRRLQSLEGAAPRSAAPLPPRDRSEQAAPPAPSNPTEQALPRGRSEQPTSPPVPSSPNEQDVTAPRAPTQQQVVAPAESSNAASAAAPSFDQVGTNWDELVNAVGTAKRSLASFLKVATLDSLEGHVLKLSFGADQRFAMTQVLKDRKIIEEMAEAKYGWRLRLDVVAKKGEQPAPQAESQPESDPTLRSVLDAFDGELV
ncbi:MAG: DNA polymerase III subunit gamma/tau [Candidatus Latescibacteria bacterium]|nr:DNA polymerase III subunit gamma/tau [Candidatus Latescibacterota bacterium]